MDVQPGSRLGPYEIVSVLGMGGLGTVYKARDPRLGRDVAIKITREQLGDQFEREARSVTALNHPIICTLFDVGPNYLVMELIEGPTLAERIEQGALPLEEALPVARQIACALKAAHDKSFVHRNLNPREVKIRPDGSVKVLGFGQAPDSLPWVFFGVQFYISPEQVRGQAVDKSMDIWAFGLVLYEMLTGELPFGLRPAVLMGEVDLAPTPEKMWPLLSRCLQKDPEKRLRDIGDAIPLLE